jgi:thioredoxin 1
MATSTKQVITELNVTQLQALQGTLSNNVLILKFSADWCGPCKKIAPTYKTFMSMCPPNIIFGEIDVDENIDLWMALKKQKMVQGIPVFLAFFGGVKRQLWFIPDDSVVGADEEAVTKFFKRCAMKAVELSNKTDAYTYYT